MRRLCIALDALPSLREATHAEVDLGAATSLAELAGVDAVRLGVNEDLRPVSAEDVREVRRASCRLELRMAPAPGMVKVALEGRPDRVVLAGGERSGGAAAPLDLQNRSHPLEPTLRTLAEAGIPSVAVVAPNLEAVKRAHGAGIAGVEFDTASIVDLPAMERGAELERLGDAVRLASKLRLEIGLGGGLGYRNLRETLESCPAATWVTVGRAAMARALLVGLDRALRDMRALLS